MAEREDDRVAVPKVRKIVIKSEDMDSAMQKEATDCAVEAMEKFTLEKDIAGYIKKEFDRRHGAIWHCIAGRSFGSYVTHEAGHFLYFYVDATAVLLFKTG
eukprot:TRINITY_DN3132_c0_g1_i1.p1 TRINITY_DN3132_c0_g1~~TRINITY_DN3132_c0_g1_i1.p1  ORF type:complete len:101 (+),score=29.22 TRINITY_DN3132_c0_g1_i1:146-448(+)